MVEDVKEGEVGELLLQHEKDGVGEVDELGDVEDPGEVESSNRLWIVGVINRLTSQAEKHCNKNKNVKSAKILIEIPVASTDIEFPPLAEPPGARREKFLFNINFVSAHQMWENTHNCPHGNCSIQY